MVTTRSGNVACSIVCSIKKTRKQKARQFLSNRDLGRNDDSEHICCFCMTRLEKVQDFCWLQCPSCKDVSHAKCLYTYCKIEDNPTCPICKIPIPYSSEEKDDSFDIDTSRLDIEWAYQNDESDESDDELGFDSDEESKSEESVSDDESNDEESESDEDSESESNDSSVCE